MIDLMPNQTFFVQVGLFLFTYVVLTYLVFKPVLRILERRKQLTIGAEQQAAEISTRTENLIREHSEKLQGARREGIALKEKFQKEGQAEANEIVGRAREEMEGELLSARKVMVQDRKEAQLVLRKYARELSQELAQKLLGRKVST